MKYIGKSSGLFEKIFLLSSAVVSGPKEYHGPLHEFIDYGYEDIYCGKSSWEQAEIELQKQAINIALHKSGLSKAEISCIIGGDLNNQLAITNYNLRDFPFPYFGVYSACATCTQALIIASIMIDAKFGQNIMTIASSHNATSERQFRSPTEYAGQKPNSTTSTTTGAGSAIVSKNATSIKITRFTIGKVYDAKVNDYQDMGRAMAPAAAMTLKQHLEDFEIHPLEYDLILTGDLSKYGSKVFIEILEEFDINLQKNYQDAGLLLYDLKTQEVFAGGSGCGCISLVGLGYVIDALKKGIYKKVLLIATGALLNPIMIAQGESIPCIAHAICLERTTV